MKSVCGLDVHKDSVYLCILSEFGELIEKVFGVLTYQLEEMRDLMLHHHVVEVSMESTGVYWIPIWRVLSPHFKLNLANPYFIKQLPGRKSDVKDAQWIAECTMKELIPGIKECAATSLIAEIGTDMNKFETANHLASWSGLKPRNDESNKKIKSRSITHGNVYLRKTIIECAWAASRKKDCFFSRFSYHQTQVRKKNKMKVLVAVARKMLVSVWHVLHDNTNYIDFTTDRKTSPTRG